MTFLPSSSTSGWSLIFAITHRRRLFFSGEVSSCSPAPASPPPPRAASLTRRHLGILWWAETSTGPSSSSLHGHGSHGGAAGAPAGLVGQPAGSTARLRAALGRARRGGPARARWQDGGGVGAAAARAARDGGRASAGGEQQPAGSMVGWSGGAGRALLAGPCGLAGRTVVGSGWRRHVLRARAGGQRRVNLTKHAVLTAAWCGTA